MFDSNPPLTIHFSGGDPGAIDITASIDSGCSYPNGSCILNYWWNEPITLTPRSFGSISAGYWSDDCATTPTGGPCTVTMNAPHTVSMYFGLRPDLIMSVINAPQ
jgi:hypothetical protein